MDELVALVAQKTGISAEKAKQAAETVVAFLKEKLPAPLAGQIDGALSSGAVGEALNKLGGLLGK